MNTKEQEEAWNDIKRMWNTSSHGKEINIAMSKLIAEFKGMTSQFEIDAVKVDLELIKSSISHELDAIKRDMATIEDSLTQLEKDAIVLDLPFFIRKFKNFFRRNKDKKE